jgi:hypothetical protein
VFTLLRQSKTVVIYLAPEKRFCNFRTEDELLDLLARCDDQTLDDIGRKIALPDRLKKSHRKQQALL